MSGARLTESIGTRFPDAVITTHAYRGEETVVVRHEQLHAVAEFLKLDDDSKMNFLMDLAVVDYSMFGKSPPQAFFASSGVAVRPPARIPDKNPWPGPPGTERFAVVYHFFSTTHKHRLRMVVPVDETSAEVDTVCDLWAGANWLEREAWDMFGIVFRDHPDLRRLLMYDEFEGHPLRKDYPVRRRQPLIGPVN